MSVKGVQHFVRVRRCTFAIGDRYSILLEQ
jgi:hypothetical protein